VSAWLKCHYPAAFCAALLNSQPMGFYAPAQLVADARRHGVEVRPVDVNSSDWDCTLEESEGAMGGVGDGEREREGEEEKRGGGEEEKRRGGEEEKRGGGEEEKRGGGEEGTGENAACGFATHPSSFLLPHSAFALRLGFNMLRGMSSAHAQRICEVREQAPFASLEDFGKRTGLSRAVLARLAKAGAFGSLGLDRRGALWHALAPSQESLPLFDQEQPCDSHCAIPPLPGMSEAQEVLADYRTAGLSLRAHPVRFLRPGLDRLGVAPASQLQALPDGKPVRVAGIVLVRQRPGTAKGITFVTLEDETGIANLIVRPAVWQRFRQAALSATVLLAHGRLQRQGEVIHVLATRLEDLSHRLEDLGPQSRDFC
jgi:error-prone DNA polymerase